MLLELSSLLQLQGRILLSCSSLCCFVLGLLGCTLLPLALCFSSLSLITCRQPLRFSFLTPDSDAFRLFAIVMFFRSDLDRIIWIILAKETGQKLRDLFRWRIGAQSGQ